MSSRQWGKVADSFDRAERLMVGIAVGSAMLGQVEVAGPAGVAAAAADQGGDWARAQQQKAQEVEGKSKAKAKAAWTKYQKQKSKQTQQRTSRAKNSDRISRHDWDRVRDSGVDRGQTSRGDLGSRMDRVGTIG